MRPIKGRSVADGWRCHAGDGDGAEPFGSQPVMMFRVLSSNYSISPLFCMCMLFIFLFFFFSAKKQNWFFFFYDHF